MKLLSPMCGAGRLGVDDDASYSDEQDCCYKTDLVTYGIQLTSRCTFDGYPSADGVDDVE